MKLDRIIKERHSVRRFSSRKVDWRDIIKAVAAANDVPLAGNLFTIKFILVMDKDKIKQLAEAAEQDFVADAQYVVVVVSDKQQLTRSYDERGERYSRQQAGAAIEHFLLKITELGLASCWVGAFFDDKVKRILQIPENFDVEALLPVGYEFERNVKRKKPNLDDVLFFDIYKNRYMTPVKKPEAI